MTLEEARNKAEAARALVDEIYHAAFGGKLKLDWSVRETLDTAAEETSELALKLWMRGEMRREAERN
jgi:hypothetical protein